MLAGRREFTASVHSRLASARPSATERPKYARAIPPFPGGPDQFLLVGHSYSLPARPEDARFRAPDGPAFRLSFFSQFPEPALLRIAASFPTSQAGVSA